ncbi:MAG: radical SAM protein [Clostridia bacterium]|nr:radical SAM protein [Clostridia bacterium]
MVPIQGFYHYRTDLGEGTRTGVVFAACRGTCTASCTPFPLLPSVRESLWEENEEKNSYSAHDLASYLLDEQRWCATQKLGITFLGREPLRHDRFCLEVGRILKEKKMSLQIWTCGDVERHVAVSVGEVCDLFVVNFHTPDQEVLKKLCPFYSLFGVESTLREMCRKEIPFRIRIPVIAGINSEIPDRLAEFCAEYSSVKSIMLDFSRSLLDEEMQREYRNRFLERGLMLY